MENQIDTSEIRKNETQEAYVAWEKVFKEKLANTKPGNQEEVINVIFEYGILNHLSPTNQEEIEARKLRERPVFDRNNAGLYFYILCEIFELIDSKKNNVSIASPYIAPPFIQGYIKLIDDRGKEAKIQESKNLLDEMLIQLKDLTMKKIEEIEGKKPEMPEIGSEWFFVFGESKIKVKVAGYRSGKINLELVENSLTDHMRLGEAIKNLTGQHYSTIIPAELFIKNSEKIISN